LNERGVPAVLPAQDSFSGIRLDQRAPCRHISGFRLHFFSFFLGQAKKVAVQMFFVVEHGTAYPETRQNPTSVMLSEFAVFQGHGRNLRGQLDL
jgi:hypothetical protein